jgi:diamine N-acetyltransferase
VIKLIEVSKESFWLVTKLVVEENQNDFIESNAQSIAESKYYNYWKPMCIYYNNEMIGFTMYGKIDNENGRVWLDRFMLDKRFQGKGYGVKALKYIINELENIYNCDEVYISIFEKNTKALEMYKREGFEFNGELDYDGEKVMVKSLRK